MDSEQSTRRWSFRLPFLPTRVAGRRRHIELPRPNLGVLREIERPSLRELLSSISPRRRRVAAYAVGAMALLMVVWYAYNSAPLSVQSVDVRGARVLSPDLIRKTAAVDDDRLTRPDFDGARQRLLALPMVKDARIERDWPFGIDITVTERNIFAVWRAGGKDYVIDGVDFNGWALKTWNDQAHL